MHHVRNSNHRKMLKPKFYSSSSDDDIDDAAPIKWKPIIASFPIESNVKPKESQSIESNPIIDSLNSKMSKQQKLSAEVIQKEEIYNQAEMEANKKMFGCANPGRCLSKDEIKRRKDIILHIVNERLKSKLSELMGEFGERIEMNETYENNSKSTTDDGTSRYRNRSPDDDLPDTPPPPTFNTSSESSDDDDLDVSMTKEFELYEKEIKEKISDVKSSGVESHPSIVVTSSSLNVTSATSSAFSLSASYNSVQVCPTNSIPNSQIHILQQTSTNYQPNWQQPIMHQWPMTDQSVDIAPWIPPVGPPQIMEPFPPPIEAEKMSFMTPPPNFPTFPNPNPTNGWTNPPPRWTHPPPTNFPSNYGSVPQYSNPEWINKSQSTPYRPAVPPQIHLIRGQAVPRMNWNARGHRPSGPYVRPIAPANDRNQEYTAANNVNVPIVSKSTYVNAILAADQKLATSNSEPETKINLNSVYKNHADESRNKINQKSTFEKDSVSQKRSYEQKINSNECVGNFSGNVNSNNNSNEITKRPRLDDSKVRKTRFDNHVNKQSEFENHRDDIAQPINSSNRSSSLELRSNSRNDQRTEPLERKDKTKSQRSPELETRHEKTNAKTFKFLSKFWNTKHTNSETSANATNSRNDQTNEPIQWTKLCDIVDKLLDLSPNILKDLPSTDRRVKERNEILMILSDDPGNFYAHVDNYGEHNVKWAVTMAQRILFPQGRYDDSIALAIAPFQNAIHNSMNTAKGSITAKQKTMSKNTVKSAATAKPETIPKEWLKLCKIVDKLLDIPTRIAESLPLSDSRIKERNDILMMLSKDPEDFLLHDEKYGAHNVDWAILAAKKISCPDGVCDERVRKLLLRHREKLLRGFSKSSEDRSISRDRESRKRSNHKSTTNSDEQRSRSLPKEWNQLCEIVDKVLDTPKEVRIKMSKRDPRWEQRENILLVLSDDPDKLASQSAEYGSVNVDWAIKSSKKIIFPNGSKDRTICKKLSPQRKLLLRNRQDECLNGEKTIKETKTTVNETSRPATVNIEKQTDLRNEVNREIRKSVVERSTQKEKTPVEKIKIKKKSQSEENKSLEAEKVFEDNKSIKEPQRKNDDQATKKSKIIDPVIAVNKELDENEVWAKLCNIVDKLLDLPPNAADKLEPSDKRLIERNDILMILSDDPEKFLRFDANYGSTNVSWAIKSAKKLIYSNGKPNEKLTVALWKQRDAIMCSEVSPKDESEDASKNECNEWICIRKIATKLFLHSDKSLKKQKDLTKEQRYQQIELLLQLSDDPDVVRSKPICKKIGEGRVEVTIAKCKHILNRMRKLDQKALLNFENFRSKMVLYSESLNQSKNIKNYDVIIAEVRKIVDQKLFYEIFGRKFNKWTKEQILERNELAILLIKDPLFLKSNAKYLEMVSKTEKGAVAEIIAEVEKCLLKCEYVKEKPAVVCPPIIAKIKDVKYMSPFKERKLTQRIHRLIEQFLIAPKPAVFDVQYDDTDGTVDVVCANNMTFDWLKSSIKELDGLWSNATLNISKAPITRKVLETDDLKEIKMAFKTVHTESFAVIMKQLKKANSKLHTDRWQSVPLKLSDPKKMFVMVDLESMIELEHSKREIIVESGTIYFDIKYIGKENFETKC